MPTTFVVAPDSGYFIVTAKFTAKKLRTSSEQEALEFANAMVEAGYEVTIDRGWDVIPIPIALIPLEAESLKQKPNS